MNFMLCYINRLSLRLQVHFIPLHWYDISLDAFKEYVESWHNTFNLPIWVTEWACQVILHVGAIVKLY